MAQYLINYLTGDTENVTADRAEYDVDARLFLFHEGDEHVALVPDAGVRSVHRQDDGSGAPVYPHKDGDVTVLGPEVFASADGETITWKGEHYTRRFYPLGR